MRLVYLLLVTVVLLDQATKLAVERFLALNQKTTVVPGVLSLTYILNPGAAFGILEGHTTLILFMAAVLFFLVYVFRRVISGQPAVLRWGLGLALGGAAGNFIDRVRLGKVIDFLALEFWPLHNWPVFNLADTAIVTGTFLISLYLLKPSLFVKKEEMEG